MFASHSITVHHSRKLGLELSRAETLKQELRGGHGGMLLIGLLGLLSDRTKDHKSPGIASLPINHYVRKWPFTARTYGGIFSVEVPSFQRTLAYIKLT